MSNLELTRAERLDQYVVRNHSELSRAVAVKLIEQGKVIVNDTPQLKPGYKVRLTDRIIVHVEFSDYTITDKIELEVLYEDDDCVVINKPNGLLSHSKGVFNPEATVASWLHARLKDELATTETGQNNRAGIVHRLDRATSGVMICAKTVEAQRWLQKQFSQRRVKKTYSAVVDGELGIDHAIIDMPIERNPKQPQLFRTGSNGKSAMTEYEVLQTGNDESLLELKPTTGRTHQLRVHLTHLGHPIVGDTLYKGKSAERLFLHAYKLEVTLPNHERKVFTVPIPRTFQERVNG
jgi:23S rRNA pseudouridine1911/1915/1917 synthase